MEGLSSYDKKYDALELWIIVHATTYNLIPTEQ